MASILDRLRLIQQQVNEAAELQSMANITSITDKEVEDPHTSKPQKEGVDADESLWMENVHNNSSSKKAAAKDPETFNTSIVRTELSALVWAQCANIKGGKFYLPARIVENSAVASYRDIEYPIPADKVCVEFFCPTTHISRFRAIPPAELRAYNQGPRGNMCGEEDWCVDEYRTRTLEALEGKYHVGAARRYLAKVVDTATQVLRLSQTPFALYDGPRSPHEDDLPEELPRADPEVVEEVDMFRYALVRRPGAREEVFCAGDSVQYEHGILKCTMTSRVIAVDDTQHCAHPLTLESDEWIGLDTLVTRIPAGTLADVRVGELTCQLLRDFRFKAGRLKDVETLHQALRREELAGRRRLEEETGLVLNYSAPRSTAGTGAAKKRSKPVDVDPDDADDFDSSRSNKNATSSSNSDSSSAKRRCVTKDGSGTGAAEDAVVFVSSTASKKAKDSSRKKGGVQVHVVASDDEGDAIFEEGFAQQDLFAGKIGTTTTTTTTSSNNRKKQVAAGAVAGTVVGSSKKGRNISSTHRTPAHQSTTAGRERRLFKSC